MFGIGKKDQVSSFFENIYCENIHLSSTEQIQRSCVYHLKSRECRVVASAAYR